MRKLYGTMERWLVPSLKYSQYVYEEVLNQHVRSEIRWLDLGCGHQMLPAWRFRQEEILSRKPTILVGIDAHWPSLKNHKNIGLRVNGDISALPFKAESFDLVTANMVVEHLSAPASQFEEISRVLRPGGLFIFHTPNALGYYTRLARMLPERLKPTLIRILQGRPAHDVFRTYYRANTEADVQRLAESTAFDAQEIRLINSSAQFAVIPPLAILELLWIRFLQISLLRGLRTNLIVILKKRC